MRGRSALPRVAVSVGQLTCAAAMLAACAWVVVWLVVAIGWIARDMSPPDIEGRGTLGGDWLGILEAVGVAVCAVPLFFAAAIGRSRLLGVASRLNRRTPGFPVVFPAAKKKGRIPMSKRGGS